MGMYYIYMYMYIQYFSINPLWYFFQSCDICKYLNSSIFNMRNGGNGNTTSHREIIKNIATNNRNSNNIKLYFQRST